MIRPLSPADLAAAGERDLLLRQLAARHATDRPVTACGEAVALWHLFGDDPELVITGPPTDATVLARAAFADPAVHGVSLPVPAVPLLAGLGLAEPMGWAFRWTTEAPSLPTEGVAWAGDEDEVRDLLAVAFPDASMPVGHPDVRRWAGLRRDGRLVAVAADATIVPGLGFLASIATHPDLRGTGAGAAVTAWSTAELVREEGACGLWHMADNLVAAALYTRLGYRDEHPMAVLSRE
ncbi:MAG TPA: GNAT family N-acetyltransferase [Mycobacteriales bacterium]|nr:GNAT family N-acetyltransferase [Mycobacteriales bacterium]